MPQQPGRAEILALGTPRQAGDYRQVVRSTPSVARIVGLDRNDRDPARINAIESKDRPGRGKRRRPVHVAVPMKRFFEVLRSFAVAPSVDIAQENSRAGVHCGCFSNIST